MNLSKTEKLLAAKKKLKEFQLNKMLQVSTAKHQSDSPENVTSTLEPSKTPENSKNDYTPFHRTEEEETKETKEENLQKNVAIEHSSKELIKCEEQVTGISEAKTNAIEKEANEACPRIQKDHLLEMASAVADVLTNNSEVVESTLDCDLATRNQFLTSYVEEQKKIVNDLYVELSNYRSRVTELEAKLAEKETGFQAELSKELGPLREQLQAHAQTTGILIAEKAELTAALQQTQQTARQNSDEVSELCGKLKNSQARIHELEKEITSMRVGNEETRRKCEQVQNEYEELERKFFELRKEKEDTMMENSELKQKLNLKKTELINVQQELQEKSALLSLSEIRVQQMKDTTQTESEQHTSMLLEEELAKTRDALKKVSEEKEEANKQYQNYVRQLDAQQTKLMEELKLQKKTLNDFEEREKSYVERISDLERQLQREKEQVENLLPLQDRKEQMEHFARNIDELTLEQEKLHIVLAEKDTQIEELKREIQEVRDSKKQDVEVSRLATALESEQLGASRAISQNQQLKLQLTDMENAFVSLSNAKLDLTEQLQAERSIGRKLNGQLNKMESEIDELKERLKEKEKALMELEKERLQSAQIADQIQHYQAQSQNFQTFQQELQQARFTIEKLRKEKGELLEQLNSRNSRDRLENGKNESPQSPSPSPSPSIPGHFEQNEVKNSDVMTTNENQEQKYSENETIRLLEENETTRQTIENGITTQLEANESIRKLETRFKETMERVAELTEEKQKLEHLVLQLQSETETIGEYITLYQRQRAVLQNRARKRDQAFRQLLDQRNQQQEQLHKLKVVLSDFLAKRYVASNGTGNSLPPTTKEELTDERKQDSNIPTKENGMSELLDLLTEIKDCKDSCNFSPDFHPCPWCSGKLLTV